MIKKRRSRAKTELYTLKWSLFRDLMEWRMDVMKMRKKDLMHDARAYAELLRY
jgi:hypothetical protein